MPVTLTPPGNSDVPRVLDAQHEYWNDLPPRLPPTMDKLREIAAANDIKPSAELSSAAATARARCKDSLRAPVYTIGKLASGTLPTEQSTYPPAHSRSRV